MSIHTNQMIYASFMVRSVELFSASGCCCCSNHVFVSLEPNIYTTKIKMNAINKRATKKKNSGDSRIFFFCLNKCRIQAEKLCEPVRLSRIMSFMLTHTYIYIYRHWGTCGLWMRHNVFSCLFESHSAVFFCWMNVKIKSTSSVCITLHWIWIWRRVKERENMAWRWYEVNLIFLRLHIAKVSIKSARVSS